MKSKYDLIGWEFPKTDWGTESGKNDPGLETFRGNPYPSVTRETIQNSIDAHDDSENPVIVKFSVFNINSDEFPGKEEYKSILLKCLNSTKKNSETYSEIEKALSTLNKEKICFMKISDYNTTGLSGSDKLRDTPWHRLIKVVGESEKEDTSGGAFGIGKYATFVCSDLRAVFYSTLDEREKKAFQGVAKLISFEDEEGEPYQATGFFGIREKKQPIRNMEDVNSHFVRTAIGTDVFIAGFDYRETWADEIKEATINSFFSSIYHGNLEVIINDESINKDTLEKHVQDLRDNESKSSAILYYEVLTSSDSHLFEVQDFHGLGEVKLYVGSKPYFNKKVAMIRKTGMLIKEKQNYQIPLKYSGVLLINGTGFNKELKRVENPTHTDWELTRKKDVKVIRKALRELNEWMNESIKCISPFKEVKKFDVDELSEFLPDDCEEIGLDQSGENEEDMLGKPLQAKVIEKPKSNRRLYNKSLRTDFFEDEEIELDIDDETGEFGNGGKVELSHKGDSGNSNLKSEYGNEEQATAKESTKIIRYRTFCINPNQGIYRIKLKVKKDVILHLKLDIIGEDSDVAAMIKGATYGGKSIPVEQSRLGPVEIKEGNQYIDIQLMEPVRVALGVNLNVK